MYTVLLSKIFLFQAIQFSQAVLFQTIQFLIVFFYLHRVKLQHGSIANNLVTRKYSFNGKNSSISNKSV